MERQRYGTGPIWNWEGVYTKLKQLKQRQQIAKYQLQDARESRTTSKLPLSKLLKQKETDNGQQESRKDQ